MFSPLLHTQEIPFILTKVESFDACVSHKSIRTHKFMYIWSYRSYHNYYAIYNRERDANKLQKKQVGDIRYSVFSFIHETNIHLDNGYHIITSTTTQEHVCNAILLLNFLRRINRKSHIKRFLSTACTKPTKFDINSSNSPIPLNISMYKF